jgi:hypothetical protein
MKRITINYFNFLGVLIILCGATCAKYENGRRTFQEVWFQQPHDGANNSSYVLYDGLSRKYDINCEDLK